MFRPMDAKSGPMLRGIVGTGGVTKGQLCMLSSDTVVAATEGQTTAVLFGVAAETALEGVVTSFYPILGKRFEIDVYTGSTIDDVTDAMIGADYDMYVDSGNMKLDLNDTTGPMLIIESYDNARRVAMVHVVAALCAI